jgi:Flp pilus assembly protein TadD
MVYFLDEDYETALTHFERATDAAPGEATYRANKAAALGMLGHTAEAAELYRKHLKQSDVHENVNVLMNARRVWSQHAQAAQAAPTTAPTAVEAPQ